MLRKITASTFALALLSSSAMATPGLLNSAPVQQDPTRLDAGSNICAFAPAVNQTAASQTCTITPPAGQSVYIDSLIFKACLDGTASISSIQQNYTSTNMGGLAWQTALISGSTITTNATDNLCDTSPNLAGSGPLKSAQSGLVVTLVPPTQAAHASFGMFVAYHFAP
jgi:hypothetical protein